MDSRTYKTKNIELASTIKLVANVDPKVSFGEDGLASLEFPMVQAVSDVVMQYESGIFVDARALLTIRNQMFRRIKGGRRD